MKSIKICSVLVLVLIVYEIAIAIEPKEIVKKADDILFGKSAEIILDIKVYRKGKEKSSMKLEGVLKGDDKMILFYTYPPRNKNNALLKNGDNLWMYFDMQKRFLSIGSRQLMGGSDFSFGDILNVNLNKDYTTMLIDDTTTVDSTQCYHLELTAKNKEVTYDKIVYYVRKDFAPVKREFYTTSGDKFKEMGFSEFKGTRPMKFTMKNTLVNTSEYSIMTFEKIVRDVEIDDNRFTKNSIQRGK